MTRHSASRVRGTSRATRRSWKVMTEECNIVGKFLDEWGATHR